MVACTVHAGVQTMHKIELGLDWKLPKLAYFGNFGHGPSVMSHIRTLHGIHAADAANEQAIEWPPPKPVTATERPVNVPKPAPGADPTLKPAPTPKVAKPAAKPTSSQPQPRMPPHQSADAARSAEETFERGRHLYAGKIVPRDLVEAVRLFRTTADEGHALSQGMLGACYLLGDGVPPDLGEAARWFRLAADQGEVGAQMMLGRILVGDFPVDARVRTDIRAGAKLLAGAAQCTDPTFAGIRIEALQILQSHADKHEVVWACCIGCGAIHGLKRCEKCDKALFFRIACMRQMWPTHKRCCKEWAAEEPPGATKDFEDAVDVMTLPSKELKRRLDRRKISYAGVLERTELVALLQSAI
mmetsp:Transcript_40600/g.100330  ORF Transcript_40600/g.100330 Transcript_40600/m.100330 type:complete len:358 (+) Transcript_40600:460-1533(+)